ncbi:MAG: hypothetical protein JWL60_398 [Gemmatimonadetes bacterium]|jgi:uncharacterized damage-inducible protein DinB|nr:hypothetical protein [Gemmatimonadota bacterium]
MRDARGRPEPSEYASFYAGYVAAVPSGEDVLAVLGAQGAALQAALARLPEERGGHRYAEGKWSVREVVGHLIDAERIFTYRALRIARGDATPLPGFDENRYVAAAGSDARAMADLLAELLAVRAGTTALFTSLPDAAWRRVGVASEREISVRALAYVAAGHVAHHLRILRERYGVA